MTCFICETCGVEYGDSLHPPAACPTCMDERQYVGWRGQSWTTQARLSAAHTVRIEDDCGVLGIGMTPSFAINQRAMLLPTDAGNVLWECISVVTEEAVAALRDRGGVDFIAISHPHFYSAMTAWSEAFGGVPILLHEDDKTWVQRPAPQIAFWSGDEYRLSDDVTLVRCGGHFPGSAALHWTRGPRLGGALFPGDALQVAMDRRRVSFMYSYPNAIPMTPGDVRAMRRRLERYRFADVFGFTWGRNIIGNGRAAVDASFDRFLQTVAEPAAAP